MFSKKQCMHEVLKNCTWSLERNANAFSRFSRPENASFLQQNVQEHHVLFGLHLRKAGGKKMHAHSAPTAVTQHLHCQAQQKHGTQAVDALIVFTKRINILMNHKRLFSYHFLTAFESKNVVSMFSQIGMSTCHRMEVNENVLQTILSTSSFHLANFVFSHTFTCICITCQKHRKFLFNSQLEQS